MNKTAQVRFADLLKLANPDGRYRVRRSEGSLGISSLRCLVCLSPKLLASFIFVVDSSYHSVTLACFFAPCSECTKARAHTMAGVGESLL